VVHTKVENVRLAARMLRGNQVDPDIEKPLLVRGMDLASTIKPDSRPPADDQRTARADVAISRQLAVNS
jgi:hypothetical protein